MLPRKPLILKDIFATIVTSLVLLVMEGTPITAYLVNLENICIIINAVQNVIVHVLNAPAHFRIIVVNVSKDKF